MSYVRVNPAFMLGAAERDDSGAFSSNASVDMAPRRGSSALGVLKRAWRPDEDETLLTLIVEHGPRWWSVIAAHLPGRVGKQCRERCGAHSAPLCAPAPISYLIASRG